MGLLPEAIVPSLGFARLENFILVIRSIRPKAQRASSAFAECPLVVSFFNCFFGVGLYDYGITTVTTAPVQELQP